MHTTTPSNQMQKGKEKKKRGKKDRSQQNKERAQPKNSARDANAQAHFLVLHR